MGNIDKAVFVIGVSGTGKSTVASALAKALGGSFLDADDFHSAENKTSMANGVPLTDQMRKGWLEAVCTATNEQTGYSVVACSALKKVYRDSIRAQVTHCQFVFLNVGQCVLEARMANRSDHFMPVSLLESQLQTLQVPTATETDVMSVDGTLPVPAIVELAVGFCNAPEITQS